MQAHYAVAADGAQSLARREVGLALRGAEDLLTGSTTLFRAPLWGVLVPHRHLLYSVSSEKSP